MKRWLKIVLPLGVILALYAAGAWYDHYCNTNPKDGARDVIDLSPDTHTAGYGGELPPDRYGIWPTTEFVTGTPESQGIRGRQLDFRLTLSPWKKTLDSFAVLRRGVLVYEYYSGDMTPDTPHYQASITKAFVSVLTGIAIKEGHIEGPDQKVLDFFPEVQIDDERKRGMTIEHLLTMTCGLEDTWYEDDDLAAWWNACASPGEALDSGLAVLAQPMEADPGEVYRYSSACYQLLGGVIARATGQNLFDYARETLFVPLGITTAQWECAADGSPFAAGGLVLSTRDMLRFGYLLLNEGRWEDREIVPADWVVQSRAKNNKPNGVGRMIWNDRWNPGLDCYECRGAHDQFICVYPSLDMVAVHTASDYRNWRPPVTLVRLWAKK